MKKKMLARPHSKRRISFVVLFLLMTLSVNAERSVNAESILTTYHENKLVVTQPGVVVVKALNQPLIAQPLIAQPLIAQPLIAQPLIAQPLIAQPLIAMQKNELEPPVNSNAYREHLFAIPEPISLALLGLGVLGFGLLSRRYNVL